MSMQNEHPPLTAYSNEENPASVKVAGFYSWMCKIALKISANYLKVTPVSNFRKTFFVGSKII
ncbi:hypothetical protein J2Y67_004754 [Neobacillus niacini]|nr:hypothetical protein [Neobacillus niacini]